MKLPLPFLTGKKEDTAYYLALLITDEKACAVILHENLGKLKILNRHEEFFRESVDHISEDNLIEVIDRAISRAEEILPPDIETHNTVFGVKEEWVEDETKKIKKEHLTTLKKVCDALDLSPIGFMVTTEAITHLVQEEEGAPISAILAEVGKKAVTLTLLRGGKKVESVKGPLKEFMPTVTVDMLLRHFTVPVLPARIILIAGEDANSLSQQFVAHLWSKSLPFLHVPQITVLPEGFEARAVTFGAAAQMGFEVSGMETVVPHTMASKYQEKPVEEEEEPEEETLPEPEEANDASSHHAPEAPEPEPLAAATAGHAAAVHHIAENAASFGFVKEQDIADVKNVEEEIPHHKEVPEHKEQAVDDEDEKPHTRFESDEAEFRDVKIKMHPAQHEYAEHQDENDSDEEDYEDDEESTSRFAFLAGLKNIKVPKFGKFPKVGGAGNKKLLVPITFVIAIILLVMFLYFFYIYKVHAAVSLTVKPNIVNQTGTIVFSTSSSNDFSKNIIAAKEIDAGIDGQVSTPATGKKDVGDKAKGSVTIYNTDSDPVSLSSGTEIRTSDGHYFTLDKDVNIPASSGDIFSGTKPGTADATVTAKELGTDSNLAAGNRFAIGNNVTIAAKNDTAFSGGTKKTVTVVSQNDIDKLKTDLKKSMQDKAKDAITQKVSGDETALPFYNVDGLEKTSFDKGVDDEAKQVTLKGTVDFKGLAYQNSDLQDYAKTIIKNHYAQDTNFADNSVKAQIDSPKQQKDGDVEATVTLQAGLLPNIDTEAVANKIDHQSISDAKGILDGLPQIASSNIHFSPNIPLLPNIFKKLPNNVTVSVQAQ